MEAKIEMHLAGMHCKWSKNNLEVLQDWLFWGQLVACMENMQNACNNTYAWGIIRVYLWHLWSLEIPIRNCWKTYWTYNLFFTLDSYVSFSWPADSFLDDENIRSWIEIVYLAKGTPEAVGHFRFCFVPQVFIRGDIYTLSSVTMSGQYKYRTSPFFDF